MSLIELHNRLANTVVLYFLALTVWGLWRFFRRQGVDSSYWGALAIAEILVLAQGGLGAYLWVGAALRPAQTIHILYGMVSVLTLPVVYVYTRGREQRREMLVYGVAVLFLAGIALRAITTGGG